MFTLTTAHTIKQIYFKIYIIYPTRAP